MPGLSAPGNGLPLMSEPPVVTCIVQFDATAVPPLSFTTCLMTTSSPRFVFVKVQVTVSPADTLISLTGEPSLQVAPV